MKLHLDALAEHARDRSRQIDWDDAKVLKKERKFTSAQNLGSLIIQTIEHTFGWNDGTLPSNPRSVCVTF